MNGKGLAAAILLCLCFGAIHAYGVLLVPIEQWLSISRTQSSAVYSSAIISLSVGVFLSGRLEAKFGLRTCFFACSFVAALGLLTSAISSSFVGLLVGFSTLYGLANGVAYSLSLVLASRAMAGREGRAMGFATAAYGLGAVLFAQFFEASSREIDMSVLLIILAVLNLLVCFIASALAGIDNPQSTQAMRGSGAVFSRQLLLLWLCYFLGAFSGLMVLAHAPSIAVWHGSALTGVVAGLVSFGSVVGCSLGGFMAERVSGRVGLALPLLLQMAAISSLPLGAELPALFVAMGLVGIGYGALTSAVPVEVFRISGASGFARDYGKAVTAWGLAGVAGPITAGYIYDLTGGYNASLVIAAALSAAAFVLVVGVRLAPTIDKW